jgi:hypothetical protein
MTKPAIQRTTARLIAFMRSVVYKASMNNAYIAD